MLSRLSAAALAFLTIGPAMAQERIRITADWGTLTAELTDNPASRGLLTQLPLTLQMSDHLRQEKTGTLPASLPGTARQRDFAIGTLGLWGPDHFVIYYRKGRVPAPGIAILGRVMGDVAAFDRPGSVSVRIERVAAETSTERKTTAMNIQRAGSQPSGKGPAEYFTGTVRIDPLNSPPEPAQVSMALVTFEPGARTAWHTHPLGQTLIVTAGRGWAQQEGGPREDIRPGDVVWFPPGVRHWHGATATTAMSHIAVQEKQNGSPVEWMEKVTDDQYGSAN